MAERHNGPYGDGMTAYVIANLWNLNMGPDIVRYVEEIDATLAPFGGRFVVHGSRNDVREGDFPGDVIVVEFPDRDSATAWYESDAYQAILPLRVRNADGWVVIVDGVDDHHRATDILSAA
jgi:uncharacterized protein (DUF1330 family)